MNRILSILACLLLVLMTRPAFSAPSGEIGQPWIKADETPEQMKNVGIDEHLGAALPLDAQFTDETGQTVTLGQYFNHGRPVIVQLGYFKCPMLCGLVSSGMVQSMKNLTLKMGTDFDVVYISIDPTEDWKLAAKKKENFVREYLREGGQEGWHLLTGKQDQITRVAQAVGFRYKWVEQEKQFAHAAAIMLATPEGKLSRYLYGVTFDPQTLRLSLVDASGNRIGTAGDAFLMICLHYDGTTGRYGLAWINLMRAGGALTVLILGVVLWRLFKQGSRAESTGRGFPMSE